MTFAIGAARAERGRYRGKFARDEVGAGEQLQPREAEVTKTLVEEKKGVLFAKG